MSPVSDRLYVCNWRNRAVFEMDCATGELLGRIEAKILQQPAVIAISHSGALYIGDHLTNSVHVFSAERRYLTSFGGSKQVLLNILRTVKHVNIVFYRTYFNRLNHCS